MQSNGNTKDISANKESNKNRRNRIFKQRNDNKTNTSSRNYRPSILRSLPIVQTNYNNHLEKCPIQGFISKSDIASSWNTKLSIKSTEDSVLNKVKITNIKTSVPKILKNIKIYNGKDVWEYTYFQHILNLRKIFENGINHLNINKRIETRSVDFLENFCIFIREYSSGKISPYIEHLSEKTQNLYTEFTIKRQE